MKTLLLLLALSLTACCKPSCTEAERNWPDTFHYGDEIRVKSGFFAGTEGVIEGQAWVFDNKHEHNHVGYRISVYHKNVGAWQETTAQAGELEKK